MFGGEPLFDYIDEQRSRSRSPEGVRKGVTVLSERQQQVLDYIKKTVAERGYPPSVREIGEALGLSSPSTVHSHLSGLVAAGALRRDPSKPRAIVVVGEARGDVAETAASRPGRVRDVPVLGRIAAGTPILAAEQVDEVIPLPVDLVGSDPVFLLEVKGDSMIDAGILDGDLVAVRSQKDARDGEIVAALIDGEEATVKRLRRRNGKVILEAENPAYEPLVYSDGVELVGKVVSVLRRYA
jgi:repressor LexA